MEEKTQGELLKEKLFYKPKNGYEFYDAGQIEAAYGLCEDYKSFLDGGKTERECAKAAVALAEEKGFCQFDKNATYRPGDKVYTVSHGKAVFLFVFGRQTVDKGVLLTAAHIDSPRLDLKPRPVYEDGGLALFKTHYYGGIKKYQWTAVPLALHGVVCKSDGSTTEISIGEDEGDPVLVLTDLLPHLAKDQMDQTLKNAIKGEGMNVLAGSRPFDDEKISDSEKTKLNILALLNEKYGITEKDFLTAELEIVPAARARDVGLDRSMIGAYGQDDRVCAYTSLRAILDADTPDRSILCALADKEEIGSEGVTGMKSHLMRYFLEDIAGKQGVCARDMYRNSLCLSADVNVAFDPNYPEVTDPKNCGQLNHGICVTKYTGVAGKAGTSDAGAELMAEVARIFGDTVLWQTGELGKVDQGGGGTVAKYIAELGIPTVDVGVSMLSMHAPWELTAKLDVYSAYLAFSKFFKQG